MNSLKKLMHNLSIIETKKYNGKGVMIQKFGKYFIQNQNSCLVCVYFPSLSGLESLRLRFLLKSRKIDLIKISKKNLSLVFFLLEIYLRKANLKHLNILSTIHGFFLGFINFEHFLYFQKVLSIKLFKKPVSIIFLKVSSQYFFYDTSLFTNSLALIQKCSNDLVLINAFFNFSFQFIINYINFLLFFHIQIYFFQIIIKI